MRRTLALVLVTGLLPMVGCGDDSGTDSGVDAGVDASRDSGVDSGRDAGRDAGDDSSTDTGTPDAGTLGCDPYTADSCPSGEKCSVVLEFGPAPDSALETITFGCVDDTRARGELAPCSITRDVTPDNSEDNTVADDCQQGLFCFTSETAPGVRVCRPLCDGTSTDCGTGRFCIGLNSDPFFGVCQTAEGCDPVFQTGCEAGKACYVIGATNGDLLGTCFSPSPQDGGVGAPGDPCGFIDSCAAGAGCFPEALPDGGLGDALCRSFCSAASMDAGVADAGAVDSGTADSGAVDSGAVDAGAADSGAADGGVADSGAADSGAADSGPAFTGTCTGVTSCLPIDSGDAGVLVPTIPGRCQ